MFNILIVHKTFGKVISKSVKAVPRVGDSVDVWYQPLPVVDRIIWYPSKETVEMAFPNYSLDCEAIVFVG